MTGSNEDKKEETKDQRRDKKRMKTGEEGRQ